MTTKATLHELVDALPQSELETAERFLAYLRDTADHVWLAHYKHLLTLRQSHIVPLDCGPGRYRMLGERAFQVTWDKLMLIANCGDEPVAVQDKPSAKPLWSNGAPGGAWTVNWWLNSDPGS